MAYGEIQSDITQGLTGATEIGVGVFTGNPMAVVAGATALVGLGMSIFGGVSQASIARQSAEAHQRIANAEMTQNELRRRQMMLTAQRQQLQTIRNSQLARSMALNSATNQGAQFGSGLAGGIGQISGDTNTSLLGLSQNLGIGQGIFDQDAQISLQRLRLSQLQGQSATAQGISSLGSSVTRAAGPIGNLSGQFSFGGSGGASYSGVTPAQSDFWNSGNVGPVQS